MFASFQLEFCEALPSATVLAVETPFHLLASFRKQSPWFCTGVRIAKKIKPSLRLKEGLHRPWLAASVCRYKHIYILFRLIIPKGQLMSMHEEPKSSSIHYPHILLGRDSYYIDSGSDA